MRILTTVLGLTLMGLALAACGGDDAAVDDAAVEKSAEAADAPPALETVLQEEPEPEPEPIPLPEGFPDSVPLLEGLQITSAEVLDAGKGMFKVVGMSTMVIDEILEHYEAVFREGGWTEDMSMANEGMTIISAIKDGFLVTVQSHQGGLGSIVTITTGNP